MNSHADGANARATGSGFAMARFLGASSPNTICAMVTNSNARAIAMPSEADSGMPAASSTGEKTDAIAGSAMKPSASEETVIPSWAPDSMKLSRLWTWIARLDRRSPDSACSTKRLRRAATNANSTATKYPFAAINATTPISPRAVSTASTSFSVGGHGWDNVIHTIRRPR